MNRKKVFRVLSYTAVTAVIVLFVGISAVFGFSQRRLHRKFSVEPRPVAVSSEAANVERGRHIVSTRGCMDCHGADLGGTKVIDDPMVGLFYGGNLTRGAGGLPSDYSDVDFVRAIRHGIRRDGYPLLLMPSQEYAAFTDEDLGAVIAYLKSVPPVDRPKGPVSPGPLARALILAGEIKIAAEEIHHDAIPAATIAPAITPTYGKYLSNGCIGCHGPNLSGGKIAGAPPSWPAAANLTALSASNGRWTESDFLNALRTHKRPDGTMIDPVMPAAFGQMNDVELKALWAYISTVPAVITATR